LDRRRLPTSADQIRRTGTPSSAVILVRIENKCPRGSLSLLRLQNGRLSRDGTCCDKPLGFGRRRKPFSTGEAGQRTQSGRQSRVKDPRIAWVPLLVSLPNTTWSPTRCHERLGVSSAAPRVLAPFESESSLRRSSRLGLRAGQDPRSCALPRRRTFSGGSWCLPPFRRPFGYVEIALHVLSDSVSPSRRLALARGSLGLGSVLFFRVALQSGSTSAFVSTPLAPKP